MSHPRHQLDDLLTHPVRFSLLALLVTADHAEFRFVRDQIEVSDSMLSKQMAALERAGYIRSRKTFVNKRGRTSLAATSRGRRIFDQHLAALQAIADGSVDSTAVQHENSHQ